MKEKIKDALVILTLSGFIAWLLIGYLSEPIDNMPAPTTEVVSVVE